MDRKYSVVSLFCGAGGLDIGFEKQGFKTIWANDVNEDACITHKSWSDAEIVCGDIGGLKFDNIPKSDVILGGFPCQGFSLAGPRKIDDSRNVLYRYFVKLVSEKEPLVFVAENVKGLLTLGNGEIINAIVDDFSSKGYNVEYHLVNAANYGVPQDRNRVLIVGVRKDIKKKFIKPEECKNKYTLEDALKNMEEQKVEDICFAPYSSRYMSRNRKRNWDEVSFTIPAMAKQVPLWPGSPNMEKIGQDKWVFGDGITRRLSYREAARIQTFDDNIEFHGDLTSKYRQIGNAVPVKLAEAFAGNVKKILDNK